METPTYLQTELQRRLDEKGWSKRALSLMVGTNDSLVKSILNGSSKNPRSDTLAKLAKAFGCRVSDLTGEKEVQENITADEGMSLDNGATLDKSKAAPTSKVAGKTDKPRTFAPLGQQLSVFASDPGPGGGWIMQASAKFFAPLPREYIGIPDPKALLVMGDEMEPRLFEGNKLHLHPEMHPVIHNIVVIRQKAAKDEWFPREYIERRGSKIVLRVWGRERKPEFETHEGADIEMTMVLVE